MRKTRLPVVYTSITKERIRVGSNEWYKWLRKVKSFRYVSQFHPITVNGLNGNNWYAYRCIAGKLRRRYLGKRQDVDFERLQLVAEELSRPDGEYWNQVSGIGS